MRYVCLGYHDDRTWAAMGDSERAALVSENSAYLDLLKKNGNFLEGRSLQGAKTATTLRFESSGPSVTDGPFAETKEQLGGFMLLEAKDLNHAIQLMSQLPCMRIGGSLEIRPLNEELST